MSEAESVRVLLALRPANAGSGEPELLYENLSPAVERYSSNHRRRVDTVWRAPLGSIEEQVAAEDLAAEYLLRTAEKVVNAPTEQSYDLWARRFTGASLDLYGGPSKSEALRLMREDSLLLMRAESQGSGKAPELHRNLGALLDFYIPIISQSEEQPITISEETLAAAKAYGDAIRERYQPILDLPMAEQREAITSYQLLDIFRKSLHHLMHNDDPLWARWTARMIAGTMVAVNQEAEEILIGEDMLDCSPVEAVAYLAHELLGHTLQGKNGRATGDEQLASTNNLSLRAGEGLGIYNEVALTGKVPERITDRYLDTALALGICAGRQMTRQQVYDINLTRQRARLTVSGQEITPQKLNDMGRAAQVHVDRIYRGGLGRHADGEQAVLTKDAAYHDGYVLLENFITPLIVQGVDPRNVFKYVTAACFDPTNPAYVRRLPKHIRDLLN